MSEYKIANCKFLITGGTGSFGNIMVRHLLEKGADEIRVLSRDEKKQDDMRRALQSDRVKFVLGDVRDLVSIKNAIRGIDYVFHAAALKQVPSCEFFPMQATQTNVVGTDNLCRAAIQAGVKKVVCLSTDKAVYPINAMGISKALMEKVVLSHSLGRSKVSDTKFCVTRYGNVIASRGSVIPLFLDQARKKMALTITNPNMTRYLMSLKDSVDLVQYAFEHANSGEVCIQKAPGASISDLAAAVNNITGNDVLTTNIGARHGEKMDEVLLSAEEATKAVDYGTFFRIPPDERDLNYNKYFIEGNHSLIKEPYTSRNTNQLTILEIEALIRKNFNLEDTSGE